MKQQGIFSYLLILTCFLILLQISFLLVCNAFYLADFREISTHLSVPASSVPGILFFIAAQAGIHLLYCVMVWFAAVFCGSLLHLTAQNKFNFALILWFVGVAAVFMLNAFYFPHSRFSELLAAMFISQPVAGVVALFFSAAFILAMITAVAGFLLRMIEISLNLTLLFLLALAAGGCFIFAISGTTRLTFKTHAHPNVIIIGIDSLRPDFLGYFGADESAPFIDGLLNKSTVFSEAVTPLARTFPSWASLLMGRHPREIGIRSNLVNTDHMDFTASMPAQFRRQGYKTVYATDETRFSNITHRFGFDEVITPPVGFNDFLLGSINDFPFSNLLVNTAIGHWLFPASYGNRPAFVTYDPDSFIELIRPALLTPREQPLFLAVHFCLPHFPYLWSDAPASNTPDGLYQASVIRIDQQIKSFFALLKEAQLLDHAIVVLLSDHGEALELSGDRITSAETFLGTRDQAGQPPHFYPPMLDNEKINASAGHGTDVLGLPQYHSLLAVKLYGMGEQRIGAVSGVVPLTDLKPALLTLAGLTSSNPLAAIVRGKQVLIPMQHIFLESDYSPASIRTVYPDTHKVLLDGLQLFNIDPVSSRLTLNPAMNEMIMRSKQYADIYGDWMLALYPQTLKTYSSILVNLQTGQWTDDLNSGFAQRSPAQKMLAQMHQFYGNELQH